ncbi:MAG: YbjQ family protein [Pyrinomonadaceae bacterium]
MSSKAGAGPSTARQGIAEEMVTTAFELPGYRVVRSTGVVRGIVVRSRSVVTNFAALLRAAIGGNITPWTRLCEQAREEAYQLMLAHAAARGANAIIGMRYDTTQISASVAEVLAYGTAVVVEPVGD